MKKLLIAAMISAVCGNAALAAGEDKTPNEAVPAPVQEQEIHGKIIAYDGGTIYIVQEEQGQTRRVDLGPKGGRLLMLTPFTVQGIQKWDKQGVYWQAQPVQYEDPDPFSDYAAARNAAAAEAAAHEVDETERDAAFYHGSTQSIQDGYYVNQASGDIRTADYADVTGLDLTVLPEGPKVFFVGRAVQTIETDRVMLFWDAKGQKVPVVLNGAYAPLGQRCTVYGTIHHDGDQVCILLDALISVA